MVTEDLPGLALGEAVGRKGLEGAVAFSFVHFKNGACEHDGFATGGFEGGKGIGNIMRVVFEGAEGIKVEALVVGNVGSVMAEEIERGELLEQFQERFGAEGSGGESGNRG